MNNGFIPINRPDFDNSDLETYFDYRFGIYPIGSKIRELESYFAELMGGKCYALFTSSAKTSLYLLLHVLKPRNKVITSPLTCFAALAPIIGNNISICYSDIDISTFNLSPDILLKSIPNNTGIILLNYLGGTPFNTSDIIEYARKNNIVIIEDCAQSLGAKINDRLIGRFGDHSIFSFTKHFSLVGGGMLLSKKYELIKKIRRMQSKLPKISDELLEYRLQRDFIEKKLGIRAFDLAYKKNFMNKSKCYKEENPNLIFQSKSIMCQPSDLQAAVILKQLSRLNTIISKRRLNAKKLTSSTKHIKTINIQKEYGESAFAKFYIKTKINNETVIKKLVKNGIDAKQLTKSHGVYLQKRIDKTKYYNDYSVNNCLNYLSLHDHLVELPLSSNMCDNEIIKISETLEKILI